MTTAPARPPLVRSSDRVIAGVCAGLASHLGWPVRMVRIGMAVAALAGGAGVAFYAWLWIMVPTADESARRNSRRPASPIAPAVSFTDTPGVASMPVAPGMPGTPGTSGTPTTAARGSWRSKVSGMPFGKEILLGAGLLLAAGILIARLLGVDVPLGTLIPGGARGQDQSGPGRRLGPPRGRARPRRGRRAGHGVRLGVLGTDLARPAGLGGRARRRGPGAPAVGAEVLARPGNRARGAGSRHRACRDRRPPP